MRRFKVREQMKPRNESKKIFKIEFHKIETGLNPLFLWIGIAWCISKVLQWMTLSEHTVWEIGWSRFLNLYGDDTFNLIVHGTSNLSFILVVTFSGLFLFMDLTLKPETFRKYKVQPHTNEPLEYKKLRKLHHEWTSSIAIIALYSHPFEHFLVNLGSVFGGIIISGCHIATAWIWLGLLLISTLADHSGYHVPFLHSSEFHDYHHLKFNVNYGATGLMDYLFGTDKVFRHTINDIRHRTLYTFKSARELFPDPSNQKDE
ncbi:CLUMA_CG004946, isoform A [Clunio marinus]|uniref:CLUMA_CG004946, isoform A n=1 Tax=Clunio marinus TaxID=568069 RepID=A0A1J1HTE8_9DIPT|nr:CLUMA_CG004946, isoform A [Clunio marinus]